MVKRRIVAMLEKTEANGRIEGATASEKSVRWYASKMRKRDQVVPKARTKEE